MHTPTRLIRLAAAGALALGSVLSIAACSSSTTDSSGSAQTADLNTSAFAERAATDGVVVLDVRTPTEYADGHLAGALNIDVESPDFADQIAALDKTAPYAIYCRSGNRSAVAMSEMADAGFTDLAHLVGGINAWVQDGRPIEQ